VSVGRVDRGLYLPNFGAFGDAGLLAEVAVDAERAGWDGLFLWDHIARAWTTDVVDPWIALAAIATRTSRIRIGPLVTPLPRRRPWKVAREAASLDRLCRGRLVLGVGIGGGSGRDVEWGDLGEESDLRTRGEMLDEALAILVGLWSGDPFSFEGRHYRVRQSRFRPPPVQSPRIPIWVAGYWPNRAPLRRAARWDGAFPLFPAGDPIEGLVQVVDFVREQRNSDAGFDLVHLHHGEPNESLERRAEAVRAAEQAGATWVLDRLAPQQFGCDWQDDWPLEAMRDHVRRGP